jgi:hypothetical protein
METSGPVQTCNGIALSFTTYNTALMWLLSHYSLSSSLQQWACTCRNSLGVYESDGP